MKRRAIVIVCDGLGVGEAPDAAAFGDAGTRTLQHIVRDGQPVIPHLASLGLLHTMYADAPAGLPAPSGAYGRLAEASAGKDSDDGALGAHGAHRPGRVPALPARLPARGRPAVREGRREEGAPQPAGLGDRGDRAVRRGAHEDGPPDRVHVGRLGLPDRGPRGGRSDRRALPLVRDRARDSRRETPRGPGHRAAVRRQAGFVHADAPQARLRGPAGRPDAPRHAPGCRSARLRDREDRGSLLRARPRRGGAHGVEP